MGDALTGDVSLDLGLVDPIDAGPDGGPADTYGPESVSPQRVWVKASGTIGHKETYRHKRLQDIFWFQQLGKDYWTVESFDQRLLQDTVL